MSEHHASDKAIGARVQELRRDRGWSESDLAATLGLDAAQVTRYESGTNIIGADKLMALMKGFGVTPNEFFDGVEGFSAG